MGPNAPETFQSDLQVEQPTTQDDAQKVEQNTSSKLAKAAGLSDISDEDRRRIDSKGDLGIKELKGEIRNKREDATRLVTVAQKTEKITTAEADQLKKKVRLSSSKKELLSLQEELQSKISSTNVDTQDKTVELAPGDVNIQKAYKTYDKLVDENEHLFGKEAAIKYKEWIREQKPTLENLEDATAKFFQSELPPRRETFKALKSTLGKWGIKDPLSVPFIEREGLSARKTYLENIQKQEDFFEKRGDLKEKLYDKQTEKKLMEQIIRTDSLQEQTHILQRIKFIEKAESRGYATLEKAVTQEKISKQSMNEFLDYYKTIPNWEDRLENMNRWEGFIENESKLTTELKDAFDSDPKNEDGFNLAFRTFKDLNYASKEDFIKTTITQRTREISAEEHNKELTITAINHECGKAQRKNTISKKTEENYKKFTTEYAKDKPYEEVKKFLDMLTSDVPNEKHKNLRAYEDRRKKYETDLKSLEDLSPQLKKKDIDTWQKEYDEKGWNKREDQHKKLKLEVEKSKDNRTKDRLKKVSPETLDNNESKETLSSKNKETAMSAIRDLIEAGAFKNARLRAAELLLSNPDDEGIQDLLDEIGTLAKEGKNESILDDQSSMTKFAKTAELIMAGDSEIGEESKRLQTQDTGLRMMEENISRHHGTIKAKDRTQKEVLEKTSGDQETKDLAEEYMEGSDDSQILEETTLKGRDVIEFNMNSKDDKQERTTKRQEVQKEQAKNKENHGGSSVIEFKQKEGDSKSLDKRAARALHAKEENALVDQMAKKMLAITHPGQEASAETYAAARVAALERLRKKEDDKIERAA